MSEYYGGFDKKFDKKDNNFALIVVLFILLIIVGVSFVKKDYY
ncbi:YjcZ family sporulation protein [Virgibacillus halodenitrificans]|nr:YjcZ family sporulation protein [Virgibacillus halodenitrificans]